MAAIIPPHCFETSRLELRPFKAGDAEAVFNSYGNDPEVARYMTWSATGNIEHTRAFVQGAARFWETGVGNDGRHDYGVHLKPEDALIGGFGLKIIDFHICFGYCLARKYWGKGIMTEALACVCGWALAQEKIWRAWAIHDAENPASGRVMEKCGFKREGVMKRASIHPSISKEPRDCVLWAKTR